MASKKNKLITDNSRKTSELLPRYFRTDANKKFLSATLDQLLQPGKAKKISGYIGRHNAKAVKSSDIFIAGTDKNRENYQLEPAAVITDYLGNLNFYKDYIDHINHIDVFGGNAVNHERLNKQEFYSWNPHVCWDKFTNFQQYYWLPYGPDPIEVRGQQLAIESTYTVVTEDEGDNYVYLFTPDGLTRNPTLTLFRGQTYNFEIKTPGNPFNIKISRVAGELERYTEGVVNNGTSSGTITFTVPETCPDVLFYVSSSDANTGGVFHVKDITENTFLDIEADVIGKKTYSLTNGIPLTNGMKLNFEGNISPSKYKDGYWYVEGVGKAIKLIPESDLEIISNYTQEQALLFDDDAFDSSPFSTLTSFPRDKDYIVINRASPDRNPWTRYNRWFHQDVVNLTAQANGVIPELDQSRRAIRPIIEFEAGLKLYNMGHKAKANVDLIDNFTTDVFSTIEGTIGYNIDGVDLANGMRVLFTADPDRFVKNKIFKVNFITVTVPGRQIEFTPATGIDLTTGVITCTNEHGLTTGNQVTYINNGNENIPELENRQVYFVSVLSNKSFRLYRDKMLTVRANIFQTSTGVHKFEVFTGLRRQINLVEETDAVPLENETVLIKFGTYNQGSMYWFNGTSWIKGQGKTEVNQPPLFDIFDKNGHSYGDTAVYDGSNFAGNKVFSYKVGLGNNDSELKFPLSYRNVSNTGDIVFDFNLVNDSFNYKNIATLLTKHTDIGFVKVVKDLNVFSYENGWKTAEITNAQPIVRIFKESGLVNNFPIDVYDFKDKLDDLVVKVYINGKRQNRDSFTISENSLRKIVVLQNDVSLTDVITLKCYSKQEKNDNGYYEIPLNLQNNPLNNNITSFTLGEVIDHVDSIVENLTTFSGTYPGNNNLRDLGDISQYGTKFVQHSGPLNLSLYHLGSKTANIVKGLEKARRDYGKFKRAFITFANESGIDTDPRQHVDFILQEIFKDKVKTQPYYLSDMFAHAGGNRLEYVVLDSRIKKYPLTKQFDLNVLSNKAVGIYLNDQQLLHGRDYVFGDDVFFEILIDLNEGDIIEAFEYESTDGCFCPPTPTKLGLYPLFEPKIYVDDTYLEHQTVIQGHDGSITIGYNDFRDNLILELEMRIFNNIKIKYDPKVFDIWDFVPGYNRTTEYSKEEFDKVLSQFFFDWTVNIPQDYTKQDNELWDRLNPFTWNYRDNYTPDEQPTPAFWRGIYRWTLDTDRPHTHPWECLGFSIKPKWWDEVYGVHPYTSNNFILWDDIKNGIIREPGVPIRLQPKFAKPILSYGKPVDENGNLVDPYNSMQVKGTIKETPEGYYTFGDVGPVESAWRRTSYYAFALIQTALLLQPNKVLGLGIDRSRIVRTLDNHLIYSETGLRVRLQDLVLPATALSSKRTYTAGLINYVIDYLSSSTTFLIDNYSNDLKSLTNKISSKLGGFTGKTKFKLLLDSKSVSSSGGIFVPEENYQIISNVSSPVKKIVYSGVAITKYADGYEVRGYNIDNPYFVYYPWTIPGKTINVGGISESYVNWESGKNYVAGKIVRANNQFYRVKISHISGESFDTSYYTRLSELPVVGGRDAEIRKEFNLREELVVSYGSKFSTIQEVVDFLLGYGAYLENQGFVFDDFNNNLKNIDNWESAVKEFLFWTTQNWSAGSVISLSPAANNLVLNYENAVVDDITDSFYEYKIFRVDGAKLEYGFVNSFRDKNQFSLKPVGINQGIYGATLHLVQKEHVVVLDNTTLFNDVIYDQEPGYRQERIKVIGYVSSEWNGGYNIPGFVYDQAKIQDWSQWTDYNLGDIVKYKEFYYSAGSFLPGVEEFDSQSWIKLEEKPTSQLLPNWDYKTAQFADFYSLDSDNFDIGQQKMAQHLIGYQKRQYLENIIQDDVSQYKFYQGMIIEKGTLNVLNKLFDVLSADDQESLTFNEEWAVRVGNYGASDAFSEIEFKLDESLFKLTPQPFELVSSINEKLVDFVYRYLPTDIYIKPTNYTNNIWPVNDSANFLRTPGYVRYDDVVLNLDTLDQIVGRDISNFKEGDYVWTAFENPPDYWNVYRFTKNDFKILDVSYSNSVLTLVCDKIPNLSVGDVIGIENVDSIKGFHLVSSISGSNIVISATVQNWKTPFTQASEILTYKFVKARTSTIDNLNDILVKDLKTNELVWVDDDGSGRYAVCANNKVFAEKAVSRFALGANTSFGTGLALSPNGQRLVVADNNDGVMLYSRAPSASLWTPSSLISPPTGVAGLDPLSFGTEINFSPDGALIAISAPTASEVNGSIYSAQGFVGVYFKSTTVSSSFDLLELIVSQDPDDNENFGTKTAFAKRDNGNYILAVTAPGSEKIYFYNYNGTAWSNYATPLTAINPGEKFGTDISISSNGSILAVSAPDANDSGAVYIFELSNNQYVLSKTIDISTNPEYINVGDKFGASVSLTQDGSHLAVGSPLSDSVDLNSGKVGIFVGPEFDLLQTIYSNEKEKVEKFGLTVNFMSSSTLVIFSANGDIEKLTTIDSHLGTTFDNGSLRIVDKRLDSGRVDIYDRYGEKFTYGESLYASLDNYADYDNSIEYLYGKTIAVATDNIVVGSPRQSLTVNSIFYSQAGSIYAYARPGNKTSWEVFRYQTKRPNVKNIKKAFIYNRVQNELVSYIDVVDPIQGKIPGPADQEISYKTYFDPAVYSVGNDNVVVDDGMNWTKSQVGTLWWDLTRAKFIDNQASGTHPSTVVYRTTTWNVLYETASIDIYEWVESKYKPSEWDALSGTDKGNALNVSGTSRYGDAVYSLKRKYDPVSQTFSNTYYYWVKNPTVTPNVIGRSLSAYSVSKLISDPVSEGYACIGLTGPDSFLLANVERLISGTDHNLSVQFWNVDLKNAESNAHSQWKVISEHPNTILPIEIEKKWIHSLTGKDDNDRTVPDIKLPFKQRYGVNFRPRQSMFINRIEALKQFIERVNNVLSTKLIADDYDLSDLESFDKAPSSVAGEWDEVIDTELELQFVGVASLEQAILTPVIENGRIVDVIINNPGYGYVNAPYVKISNTGKNAVVKTVIDLYGRVVGINIINEGLAYQDETTFEVRPFAVLVNSDSTTFNKWSIYYWNTETLAWDRVKGQAYDVTKYWSYLDWYDIGYNQFTKIDHVVDNTYQLTILESNIGDIVKVQNVGTGGWLLLEKYNNITTIDYTQNYKVVGRNNGTIQFLDTLYNFTASGYDSSLHDATLYDNLAEAELSIIIDVIKNKILVDELRVEYLKLFFASIRYVLNEQTFVDWVFKTSFVKATHNVGNLKQKVNYNSDNLPNFEDYVKEVKPYRTQIREYISSYKSLEKAQTSVTDFDLLPIINANFAVEPLKANVDSEGNIQSEYTEINSYPWKHWLDNVGFTVESIEIVDGGSGYISNPVVKIEGGYGSGASAKAYVSNGKVNRIQLISGGTGYLKAPLITIEGGLRVGGTAARAAVKIENEVIRSNKITVKFDRITKNYFITEINETETFTGTGSKLQFALKFSPDPNINTSSVLVNGVEVLRNEYSLTTKTAITKGFTSYYGLLTLASAPDSGATIEVTYKKNFNHLSAADRINFYYNPSNGQFGKDLAQLMTGIDFGGVNITGLGFGISGGWDSLPWFTDSWDGFDAAFDDYIVSAADNDYEYTLPYKPAVGEKINVYVNGSRIDDPYFDEYDGVTVQPNGRKIAPEGTFMTTLIGDGLEDTFTLPTTVNIYGQSLQINEGDKVIFRRETSEGSYNPLPGEYDTQLSGGNFATGIYATATGFNPDDIVLDGEGFITPAHSHAPEEIVPGHIADTLAIKVYQLPTGGSARILYNNYLGDGTNTEFDIGQILGNFASIIVKVDNEILTQDVDFTVNWNSKTVSLTVAPANKIIVNVISFGVATDNLLDTNYFISDGATLEYVTDAPYLLEGMGSIVLVDGEVVSYELFRTNEGYDSTEKTGIRFGAPLATGAIISYVITSDNNQTASIIKREIIEGDDSTTIFDLTNQYGNLKPTSSNIIVIQDGGILTANITEYFTLENDNLIYNLRKYKSVPYVANPIDYKIYVDGVELEYGSEYIFDVSVMSVELRPLAYKEGAVMSVVDFSEADYSIENNQIIFTQPPASTSQTEIISFYNHDVQDIERSAEILTRTGTIVNGEYDYYRYQELTGGKIRLSRMCAADDFVWIIKNKVMLSHSSDYYLDSDLMTVKLKEPLVESDVIDVIIFSDRYVKHSYGYMQFKDILNRTHYKRISKAKSTRLARDLRQKDAEIYLLDGSKLSPPNPALNIPGIVEINGERIEYFSKVGNVLGQLRRGTLGTGVPALHRARTIVLDIGTTETIPYQDRHIVETVVSPGNLTTVSLNYRPSKGYTKDATYNLYDSKGAVSWFADYGYKFRGDFVLGTQYYANEIVEYSGVYYKNKISTATVIPTNTTYWTEYATVIPAGYGASHELDIFVGGYRLKKNPYKLFEESNGYPYSPEGDSIFAPEFSVSGSEDAVRLTTAVAANTKIVVVKKTGKAWTPPGETITYFNNDISNFIKNTEAIFSQYLVDKYQYVLASDEGFTLLTDDNEPLELD